MSPTSIDIIGLNQGIAKVTDVGVAVDVTDLTASINGTTKKYPFFNVINLINSLYGFNVYPSCYAATTVSLNATYNNGVSGVGRTLTNAGTMTQFVIDGFQPPLNSYVLVKNESNSAYNGIYQLTTIGSSSTNWVLTAPFGIFDSSTDIISGGIVLVQYLTANVGNLWQLSCTDPVTVGTSALTFSVFSMGNGPFISQIATQTFTTSGSYVPTHSMQYCRVRMVGGGGAGGQPNISSGSQSTAGAGGQAGCYSEGWFSAQQIGASQTVTIGAAGLISAASAGGNGGQTSLGSLITAPGGFGGGILVSTALGTLSGHYPATVGTGGFINSTGASGGPALVLGVKAIGGFGGSGPFGGGSQGYSDTSGSAIGLGYGAGGGGGISENTGGVGTAVDGTAGFIIIEEFLSV